MTAKREKDHPHERKTRIARSQNQRQTNRREQECEGYAYIEMIGWIDRREKCRRDGDRFNQ